VSARVGGGLWLPGTKRRAAPNIGKYGRQFIICVILSINWGATLLRSTYLDSSRHPDSNGIDVFTELPIFVLSVVPTITSFQTCTCMHACKTLVRPVSSQAVHSGSDIVACFLMSSFDVLVSELV